jgi:hypothetical protein
VLIPRGPLLESFSEIVNPMRKRRIRAVEENRSLAAFRGWLLPILMNGQVTIREDSRETAIDAMKVGQQVV